MAQALNVVVVEADTGLVEDVKHVGERRIDVLRNLAALRLAARQRAHGAVQTQIAQANLLESRQTRADGGLQVDGQRLHEARNPRVEFADRHGARLGDVDAVDLARQHALAQSRAVAVGAHAHAQHGVEHRAVQQALFRVDDAAVHARDDALVLCRLGPVGRRVLQPDLRTVQEQVQFFGRVVLNLFVKVKQAAVRVAYPAPAAFAKGDVVYRVLVVKALVEVDEFVDVEFANLAQARTARATALGVVKRERLGIAHKGLAHTRKEQAQQRRHVGVGGHRRSRVLCRLLLVDDDGDRQVLDGVDMRTTVFGQILLHKRRERVVQLSPRLGRDGVEHERTLARPRHAREHGDGMLRDGQRDILQVILPRSLDYYSVSCVAVHKLIK